MRRTTTLLLLLLLACGDDDGSSDADVTGDARASDAALADGAAGDVSGDAGPDFDAGPPADDAGADAGPSPSVSCAERSASIAAAAGRTIEVAPAGPGMVSVDGSMRTLRSVVSDAATGDTILLADGIYTFPPGGDGTFTGLYFTTPGITLRSASGDASAVVLDSAYGDHGNSSAPITVAAADTVLADFTVQRSVFHLIHLWADGDNALVHNITLIDGGQQFLKASPGGDARVDNAEISCSRFIMTDEGRDNVWGYGDSDGNTTCYTGGIDSHDSRDWHVHDNYFDGIYCDADGPARPVHGMNPDQRGGQSYRGGLSEHAIHMWDSESGSGHNIERNHIVNCARGIGLGFRVEVYGTRIANNMIFSEFAGSREHDVGISVERALNTEIFHNTVFFSSPDAYPNAIEYRWGSTSNLQIRNNLVRGVIRSRNDANAELGSNITGVEASAFVDGAGGDLHLASCDDAAIVGAGEALDGVGDDFDGQARAGRNDVGADHCE